MVLRNFTTNFYKKYFFQLVFLKYWLQLTDQILLQKSYIFLSFFIFIHLTPTPKQFFKNNWLKAFDVTLVIGIRPRYTPTSVAHINKFPKPLIKLFVSQKWCFHIGFPQNVCTYPLPQSKVSSETQEYTLMFWIHLAFFDNRNKH